MKSLSLIVFCFTTVAAFSQTGSRKSEFNDIKESTRKLLLEKYQCEKLTFDTKGELGSDSVVLNTLRNDYDKVATEFNSLISVMQNFIDIENLSEVDFDLQVAQVRESNSWFYKKYNKQSGNILPPLVLAAIGIATYRLLMATKTYLQKERLKQLFEQCKFSDFNSINEQTLKHSGQLLESKNKLQNFIHQLIPEFADALKEN